jgi:hypothetical protein
MILVGRCTRPVSGKGAEYFAWLGKLQALLEENNVPSAIKAAEIGAEGIEIYQVSMFENMIAFGEKYDATRGTPAMQAIYAEAMQGGFVELVDSFTGDVLPAFEGNTTPATGVIAASIWRPNPGRIPDLVQGMMAAKAIHEKHGAQTRAWMVNGGRWTGCISYTVAVDTMTDLGKVMEGGREEYQAMMTEAAKNPSAVMVAQRIMNTPMGM